MGRARLHPLTCPSWLAHDAYAPGMADEASTIGLDKRKEWLMIVPNQSTQFYGTAVTPNAAAPYDPTADSVKFCFLEDPAATPEVGQVWTPGVWQPGGGPRTFIAQCLIGPANGGLVLAPGNYQPWCKVSDDPEVPIIACPEQLSVLP